MLFRDGHHIPLPNFTVFGKYCFTHITVHYHYRVKKQTTKDFWVLFKSLNHSTTEDRKCFFTSELSSHTHINGAIQRNSSSGWHLVPLSHTLGNRVAWPGPHWNRAKTSSLIFAGHHSMFTAFCGYGEGDSWTFHPGCYTTDNIKNVNIHLPTGLLYASQRREMAPSC